jgi:glycosyltransferase involved in cell wall biosynthesis
MDGQLVIAGDGPLRTMCELLRARSSFRERIALLGAVDAPTGERLRTEADIFTAHNCRGPLSHQEEAFGVSVVEAMAAGLPVVSGRSGSLPELIEHGREGLLVEPGDVEGHADAFLRLASDPGLRQSMGEAGWRRAKERFSCERERGQLRAILGLDGRDNEAGAGTSRGER